MRYVPIGDCVVRVEAGKGAAAIAERLGRELPTGVLDVVAAFDVVNVVYDVTRLPVSWEVGYAWVCEWIERSGVEAERGDSRVGKLVEIEVEYGGEDGPDLGALAERCGVSVERLISLHSGVEYRVAAVGFLPGFAYLEGLSKALHTARRETPRVRVPAGSVGIGGPYTGVYPVESPGGWHLIGRTRQVLFEPGKVEVPLWSVGDRVRFRRGEGGRV